MGNGAEAHLLQEPHVQRERRLKDQHRQEDVREDMGVNVGQGGILCHHWHKDCNEADEHAPHEEHNRVRDHGDIV